VDSGDTQLATRNEFPWDLNYDLGKHHTKGRRAPVEGSDAGGVEKEKLRLIVSPHLAAGSDIETEKRDAEPHQA